MEQNLHRKFVWDMTKEELLAEIEPQLKTASNHADVNSIFDFQFNDRFHRDKPFDSWMECFEETYGMCPYEYARKHSPNWKV